MSDALSSVLTKEPDWERLPAKVRPLVRACLEKDQKRRLRDIGEAWRLMAEAEPAPTSKSRLPWVIAAAVGVALTCGAAHSAPNRTVRDAAAINLDLNLEGTLSASSIGSTAILSPDGSRVVFVSETADGMSRLSTRRLDEPKAIELPGTDGAQFPFFSPDGQWVGFFAKGKLKKTRLDGGEPIALCDAPSGRGGTWNEDNTIVAALDTRRGLSQIPADGGGVTRIASVDTQAGEISIRFPHFCLVVRPCSF